MLLTTAPWYLIALAGTAVGVERPPNIVLLFVDDRKSPRIQLLATTPCSGAVRGLA